MSYTTKESFEWLKSTTFPVSDEFLAAVESLEESRDLRRIERIVSGEYKSDSANRYIPSISSQIGDGRANGTLTECGRFLELYLSSEPILLGTANDSKKSIRPKSKEQVAEARKNIAQRVNHRARKSIRRIVNANDFRAMVTLTLAPPSKKNDRRYSTVPYVVQRDYEAVRKLLKAFLRRCRDAGQEIQYLAVFELHDSPRTSPEKRGTWHIHLACHVDRGVKQAVARFWRHGRWKYQDFRWDTKGKLRDKEIANPGGYIAEYIGKEGAQFGEDNLRNKRRYTTSRGVLRPIRRYLGYIEIGGDFDTLEYRGKRYKNVFYSSSEVPGTNKLSVSATYMEVS